MFTLDDVDTAFDRIIQLKYSQSTNLRGMYLVIVFNIILLLLYYIIIIIVDPLHVRHTLKKRPDWGQKAPSLGSKEANDRTKAILCAQKRARELSVPIAFCVMQGVHWMHLKCIVSACDHEVKS